MSIRNLSLVLLSVLLSSVAPQSGYAQYQVEPDAPRNRTSYRVRVVNDMGQAICVKIIPYGKSNYFHADLGRGESTTQELWAGQRALCVWDDRTGQLLFVGGVTINRSGKLRIRPLFAAMPGAEPGESSKRAAAGVPSVEIEPE